MWWQYFGFWTVYWKNKPKNKKNTLTIILSLNLIFRFLYIAWLVFPTIVQLWCSVIFTVYWARFNMYPVLVFCGVVPVAMATEWSAEGNISILSCESWGTSSVPFVSHSHRIYCTTLRVGVYKILPPPFTLAPTPTDHLLHRMHAGISRPDRLNRWSAQTVCLYDHPPMCQMGLKHGFGGSFQPCK